MPGMVPALQTPALLGVNMDEQAMNRKHCKNASRTVCGKAGGHDRKGRLARGAVRASAVFNVPVLLSHQTSLVPP